MADGLLSVDFSMFFDRSPVIKAIKDGAKGPLSRFGAFVWKRAKTSIRKSKKISSPGSPPNSHVGNLRNLIFFGYDADKQSVVIGPKLWKAGGSRPVPNVLEFGGTSTTSKNKAANYKPHPFMGPALTAELPNFAPLFKGSVK